MPNNKLTEQDLLALGAVFEDAIVMDDPDGFKDLPEGEYLSQVTQFEIKKTKSTNKLMAAWRFKVVEGEEGGGRYIFKNLVIEDNPANMKRLISDLGKFGLEINSLADILENMNSVVDEFCVVQLKDNDNGGQWATIDTPEI